MAVIDVQEGSGKPQEPDVPVVKKEVEPIPPKQDSPVPPSDDPVLPAPETPPVEQPEEGEEEGCPTIPALIEQIKKLEGSDKEAVIKAIEKKINGTTDIPPGNYSLSMNNPNNLKLDQYRLAYTSTPTFSAPKFIPWEKWSSVLAPFIPGIVMVQKDPNFKLDDRDPTIAWASKGKRYNHPKIDGKVSNSILGVTLEGEKWIDKQTNNKWTPETKADALARLEGTVESKQSDNTTVEPEQLEGRQEESQNVVSPALQNGADLAEGIEIDEPQQQTVTVEEPQTPTVEETPTVQETPTESAPVQETHTLSDTEQNTATSETVNSRPEESALAELERRASAPTTNSGGTSGTTTPKLPSHVKAATNIPLADGTYTVMAVLNRTLGVYEYKLMFQNHQIPFDDELQSIIAMVIPSFQEVVLSHTQKDKMTIISERKVPTTTFKISSRSVIPSDKRLKKKVKQTKEDAEINGILGGHYAG